MQIYVSAGVSVHLNAKDRIQVIDGKYPEIDFSEEKGDDSVRIRLTPEQLLQLGQKIERAMRDYDQQQIVEAYRAKNVIDSVENSCNQSLAKSRY